MMVPERAINSTRHASEELSPGLRVAVERILNDRLPAELTPHALESVRCRIRQCPPKARCRIISWSGLAIAASIVVMALAAYDHVLRTVDSRSIKPPASGQDVAAAGQDVAAAFADDLPTLWVYSRAANKSPEALDKLLDRQEREPVSANSRLLATTDVSTFSFVHAITLL